ncbi:Hsp20 family protein [Luteibacter aegosomatissinici]|uniref:Hsp20 family protein n=1 Tax=Luteibacter aegosomatissinici TaxID=2911539 RepID=UPI001FFC25BE|nr:Hsp20 family protein [Luteibacter aegosomatissinici]UPG92773.1 Hsp20 family protein [Luteibacter aegosomatissinici]
MRTLFDITPLHRSNVGLDRVFDLLEATAQRQGDDFPPFDSIRLSDNRHRLTIAVPGFTEDEVAVSVHQGALIVSGERKGEPQGEYLHRGIASRVFSRRFPLAEHVDVVGATLAHGLLSIDLVRDIPEAEKPRTIPVSVSPDRAEPVRQIGRTVA